MFRRIGNQLTEFAKQQPLWTNVYGFARTLIALSLAITLIFNHTQVFFRPAAGIPVYPLCERSLSLFCFVPNDFFNFEMIRWVFIILLLVIASGWRPRITGIIHFYIAYSFYSTSMTQDGGDQVGVVLALLLVPLTLTDSRKWHWEKPKQPQVNDHKFMIAFITGLVTYIAIRIQVSIIYLNAAYAKVLKEHWIDGTAVYYFLQDPLLGTSDTMGKLILPFLETPFVAVITWGTIILEFLLFAALVAQKKWWKWFLVLGIALHASIAIVIGLYSFSLVMFAALILFLRPLEQAFDFQRWLKSLNLIKLGKKGGAWKEV